MAAAPPPKPWERNRAAAPSTLTASPAVPAMTSTSIAADSTTAINNNTTTSAGMSTSLSRPVPSRPWERGGLTSTSYSQPYGGSSLYGGSTGYGGNTGMYGNYGSSYMNQYGSMGSSYGGGYGMNSMSNYGSYARPGMYGGYGGSSMYGSQYGGFGSSYSSPMYSGMGGYGNSLGPPGMFDPNNPPAQPPTAWQHFLMAMNGALQFFSKICFLVDENTHAFHFFINALLQLLDRAGSLYGELARFILRLLRRKRTRTVKEIEQVGETPLKQQQLQQQPTYEVSQALVPRNPWTPPVMNPAGANWDGLWQN